MTAYGGQKCVTVRPGRYVHHGVQRYDLEMIMMGGVANRGRGPASCTFLDRALLRQQMLAVAGQPQHDRILLMKVSD